MRILLAFLVATSITSTSSAQDAKARISVETQGEIYAGQSVTLNVELLAPGYFASAASFHLPDPPGILLIPPTGSPVVSGKTVDGTYYTIQQFEISALATSAGVQTVPPFKVGFRFKRQPLDKECIDASLTTEAVSFETQLPPGAEELGFVICARTLKADESWSPAPGNAKAGDAFTRTVTITAPDVQAMAFPPFHTDRIDGLGIYPKPPEVLNESNRGLFTGTRRDTITYVCERPGKFEIPAARLHWFDLDAKQVKTIDFPARTLNVAPNPAMAAASTHSKGVEKHISERLLVLVLTLLLTLIGFALLAWKTRVRWKPALQSFRARHLAPLNPTDMPE